MREIAEEAGVTKAALYHHFPDKESLYKSAMAAASDYMCESVATSTEGVTDPVTRLRAIVHAHFNLFVTERGLMQAMYQDLFAPHSAHDDGEKDIHEHERPLREALEACAEAGYLDPDDVPDTTLLIMGAIEYGGARWLLHPSVEAPSSELADHLLALAIPKLAEKLRTPADVAGPTRKPEDAARHPRRRESRAHRVWKGFRGGLRCLGLAAAACLALAGAAGAEKLDGAGVVVAIPGDSPPYTLESCIERALSGNAGIEAERTRLRELSGDVYQAAAQGLPTIDLNGTWSRSRDPSFALDETFGGGGGDDTNGSPLDSLFGDFSFIPEPGAIPAQTYWRASVDARWEIRPGLVYNAVGAANVGVDQQKQAIIGAEHRLIEETMSTYYAVVLAAEQVRSLEAELEAREEFRDIAVRRFRLESATALDTLQATVSLANLQPSLRRARQDLRTTGSALNVLMGRDPHAPIAVLSEFEIEDDPIDEWGAVSYAMDRPDIRQLESLEKVFKRNYGAQKAMHYPFLSLNGSYGFVGRELKGLDDEGHDFWSAGVTLTVPVFDGFLTKGRLREAGATVLRTRQEREELSRQARLEVLSLHGELEAARENLNAAELNMTRAEDARRFATLRYENGKANYLTVLNAQSERFAARTNLIQARFEVLTGTAALKRAMGVSPMTPLRQIDDLSMRSTEEGSG